MMEKKTDMFTRSCFICGGVRLSLVRYLAITPATWGEAMDVPEKERERF